MVQTVASEIMDRLPYDVVDDLAYLSNGYAQQTKVANEYMWMSKMEGYLWALQATDFIKPYEESYLVEWLAETDRSREIESWYPIEFLWLKEEN